MDFKVGDTVMLKSGGEVMTVEAVSEKIDCVWFNGKKVERSRFDPATLIPFKDSFSDF